MPGNSCNENFGFPNGRRRDDRLAETIGGLSANVATLQVEVARMHKTQDSNYSCLIKKINAIDRRVTIIEEHLKNIPCPEAETIKKISSQGIWYKGMAFAGGVIGGVISFFSTYFFTKHAG